MCDLVAPLLVTFNDEAMAYSCFKQLMKRMSSNFPQGIAMDKHFANMRALIQILDSNLFEHMHQRGDYTHFYFSFYLILNVNFYTMMFSQHGRPYGQHKTFVLNIFRYL